MAENGIAREYIFVPDVYTRSQDDKPTLAQCWRNVGRSVTKSTSRDHTASLKISDIGPMLVQCWATVRDAGLTLYQHWASTSCLASLH